MHNESTKEFIKMINSPETKEYFLKKIQQLNLNRELDNELKEYRNRLDESGIINAVEEKNIQTQMPNLRSNF